MTQFVYNDGGRSESGFKGKAGDCVCRAISIITEKPYEEVYRSLAEGNFTQRKSSRDKRQRSRSADHGIIIQRKWFKDYMKELGFTWVPTMKIGQGCKVHLRSDELPEGRIVVNVSKHLTAMIDGVIHDTHDPSRDGTRCVYGYWIYN